MSSGLVVPKVNGSAKGLQRVFIALLHLPQGCLQLLGPLRNHFLEMLAVMFDFLLQPPLMQGALEASHDGGFAERFDEIVVGTGAHGLDTYVHVVYAGGDE